VGRKLADLQAMIALFNRRSGAVEWAVGDTDKGVDSYYAGLRFHLYAAAKSGQWLELVDGGAVNWTQKLLSNAKERCVTSEISSERICMEWAAM